MNRERLTTRPRNLLTREHQRLAVHSATLRGLDPAVTMARGWSITHAADGTIIRSTKDVKSGDTITTRVADGTITSTVEK
jgi:exodeoxyribonuclease VII large subunit